MDFAPTIKGIDLQIVNLFVGRNGSGKSYALRRIEEFSDILSEKATHPVVESWKANFVSTEKDTIEYSFGWNEKGISIKYEKLIFNNKILIDRNQETCKIFSEQSRAVEIISPPQEKLVLHVRRDIKAYPEFEKLIQWAATSYSFRFGTIVPDTSNPDQKLLKINLSPLYPGRFEFLPADLFDGLSEIQRNEVTNLMQQFGYNIEKIEAIGYKDNRNIYYQEEGNKYPQNISSASQGTFRIFILLFYFLRLVYTQKQKPQLVLIDDLGEGLDYSRAFKLGKFIFDKCKELGIQLIATSNDGFLMDAVPIHSWNVLRRSGSEITALNKQNHPKLFEDFVFTGLSNFDFFSSDYIDSHLG